MSLDLNSREKFIKRHIGPDDAQLAQMLHTIGVQSMDELIDKTVPKGIRLDKKLDLPEPKSEYRFLREFRKLAAKNKVFTSFIGMGYYDTVVPGVIQRNILENPGWYTAYTPYQAEIAQGRLEMLLNFQTMVSDLTGMELANASLLDEGTAAAEAMSMMYSLRKGPKKNASAFFVSEKCHPQTIEVLKTRSEPHGIELIIGDHEKLDVSDSRLFGALLQYPATDGTVYDYTDLITSLHEQGVLVTVAADLLSLALLKSPGEMGADVVIGSAQRFGVPMGYGGPHAAYFATKETYKRQIPGRIIGVAVDAQGNPAFRMALQTREQHIRREKATSNICTAQVLLAVMAGAYGVYHGPHGIKKIAERVHSLTKTAAAGIKKLGYEVNESVYFDTFIVTVPDKEKIRDEALSREINLRYYEDNRVGISFDEAKTAEDVQILLDIFASVTGKNMEINLNELAGTLSIEFPDSIVRTSKYMEHPVFNLFHTEHEMLRYLKRLENKDLSLVHSMISLGSCTMKLNASTEMVALSWPEFAGLHPFVPVDQARGYEELFGNLEHWLSEITGFSAVSLQPNSGAQGEYSGLMVIRAYHKHQGEGHRNIALIPSSAHGTNPASAVMAGLDVIVVKCDDRGNIDVEDLKNKASSHAEHLAALMVTYPSTHGVFEEDIKEICHIVHQNGGLVYMDGANMNAQVGLTSPATIGADVCHLNLHKTFCIPHGGGGPGMGPIAAASHLAPFLPGHKLIKTGGQNGITAVSSAPWGSASILTISYAYIAMMGGEGLTEATKYAILNANYIRARLNNYYKVLYTGRYGFSAHEMIVDTRPFKQTAGIEVIDIAKRLMDYGFHAPTVSFPVPGTLMVEPTESETKDELDRFCDAMIAIRKEIQEVEDGTADQQDNVLKNAPHTYVVALSDNWDHSYGREKAVFPLEWVRMNKFWPAVSRVDDAYGDRNLVCACPPIEDYMVASHDEMMGI